MPLFGSNINDSITGNESTWSSQKISDTIVFEAYRDEDSTYTIVLTDRNIECTANSFTVTLPTAVGIKGQRFTIDNSGVGVITLEGDGSETINKSLNQSISAGLTITVTSNGVNWRIK